MNVADVAQKLRLDAQSCRDRAEQYRKKADEARGWASDAQVEVDRSVAAAHAYDDAAAILERAQVPA